ncbi:MAG TPA: protein kinase [Candidatus Sulfotelmatobacter sp.]|nr:protein kinase [Candidatus Sulfotelmatobacter sp.]
MALPIGAKLGQYEIISPLGAGGMGEVYRARDPQLGRDVAIKILPAFLSRDPDRLRRFEQEARSAAALNHPNILAVYHFGLHDGTPYLVSELLEGNTLREILLRGPVPVRKAVDYAIQIAHGLAAAHEKGIVHRDLKPENLFLTKDGRIKILDFGLAKVIEKPGVTESNTPTMSGATEPGVVLGTAGYMAPEQVRGEVADSRADLFALGSILHEMLTGERAFHKTTSAETMSAILNEEPPPVSQLVPGVPPALQKVVHRCLEKAPQRRFHSASDLAFALEALSDSGSAIPGMVAGTASPKRGFWIAVGAAMLVIAAMLGVWLMRSSALPVIESVVQLTNDGEPKEGYIATDGSRIYFNEGAVGSLRIAQVSAHGGETGPVATNLVNAQIAGLTADGSSLLVLVTAPIPTQATVWSLPLPAGEARRLVDTEITDFGLFPDGRLIYAVGKDVLVAEKDGSNARKLEELSKYGVAPNVSPDGKQMIFFTSGGSGQNWMIHMGASDGTGIHTVLKSGEGLPTRLTYTVWSSDGKYILFGGQTNGRTDIWALGARQPLLGRAPAPVRLTNGPASYDGFVPSRDGKQIFAVGAQRRGELVRYDSRVREFVPFLGGISAYDVTFSRDGKWAAYLSYPEHTLWRSRADGSDRLQLTYPPLVVEFPRISPDGTRVAFCTGDDNIYLANMAGGKPVKLLNDPLGHPNAPDWSPDGNLLALTFSVHTSKDGWYPESGIFDTRTGKVSTVPDSKSTIGPWFATQDTLIAIIGDQSKFVVYDFKTGKWTDLVTNPDKFVNWEMSPTGDYFFYQTAGNDPKIYRMKIKSRTIEEVASLKTFRPVQDPYTGNTQLNVAPDNSPVLTRDVGTQEVYALTVKWP